MKTLKVLCCSLLLSLSSLACRPQTPESSFKNQTLHNMDFLARELGSGFDSLSNKKLAPCVDLANIRYSGSNSSDLEILNDATAGDLIDETSVGVFAGLNLFGLVSAKVSGDIITNLSTTDETGAMIYKFAVRGKTANVQNLRLNNHGMDVLSRQDPVFFREQCGDQFVHQVNLGGKLFVALKYHFTSKEAKDKLLIQLKGSALWGLIKWKKEWSNENKDLLKNVRISVIAYQIGGDPRRLDELKNGMYQGSCGADDVDKCGETLDKLIIYGREDFPKQLENMEISPDPNRGPAILAVNLVPFAKAQIKSSDEGQTLKIAVDGGLTPGRAAADSLSRLTFLELELSTELARLDALDEFSLSREEAAKVFSTSARMHDVLNAITSVREVCTAGLSDKDKASECADRITKIQSRADEVLVPVTLTSR